MNLQLSPKVVLVTGGSRGIGRAIVHEMAQAGAHVVFTYAGSTEKANALAAELHRPDRQCLALQADAAQFARAQEVVEEVVRIFGRLDVLVNNAGITQDNLLLRLNEDNWDQVLDTNLKSAFNYTKAVAKPMLKQRSGSIINMGSIVGLAGNAGQSNYSASKAGLVGFSKSIAQELGSRNIRCNVVAPGFIETEMTGALTEDQLKAFLQNVPLNRAGKATEVAQLCVFLASDAAAYISGQVIGIDGAMR